MNRFYFSCNPQPLCAKLAENLRSSTQSLFSKTSFITQSAGMNAWLTPRLAEENGVLAHFGFFNPEGFLLQVSQLLTGEPVKNNRDTIKYSVYSWLADDTFREAFPEVSSYYENNDLRRLQLAEKIADLFDQYQLYRPAMVHNWGQGKLSTSHPAEKWQMWLWNTIAIPPRTRIIEGIFDELQKVHQQTRLKSSFPEIHFFGVSVFTQMHRDFYLELGKYIDVNFYLFFPTRATGEYSHELLETFGAKSRELATWFGEQEHEWLPHHFNIDTLLGRLQKSIMENTNLAEKEPDDSIQVSSHFTPVREVEALYSYLLDLFEKDQNPNPLTPRDILVITPDINRYEPFVKAVFRNAPVKLPFGVWGASGNSDDSITSALELLMTMHEDDMTAENVMGLLEQKRISRAFGIDDCSYVRDVVNKANIRYGRTNRLEDHSHYVSWKYGLDRIILGYAMLTDDEFDDIFPYRDAEASRSYNLLRLKGFVDALEVLFDAQNTLRTLASWKRFFIEEVLEKMVFCNGSDREDREERNHIYRLLTFADQAELQSSEISYDIFLHELRSRLFNEPGLAAPFSGGITFASAIPARGLQYRVIAFLGLDNGVFPRQDHFMGFDLLGNEYRMGDRSVRESDKSLFLETLMVASQKLYLSYIGQSTKDNSPVPPSIVLDTLVDYLGAEIVQHPLHGFSSRYDNEKLFTFLYADKPVAFTTQKTAITAGEDQEEVSVKDFLKFFEAPVEWYFNKVLGIYYGDNSDTLPDTELFNLDHLQMWMIKNELMSLDNGDISHFISKGIKQGKLPLKNSGTLVVEMLDKEILPLRDQYRKLTAGKAHQRIVIDRAIDSLRIRGTLDGIFDGQLITYAFSDNLKYRVRAFVSSLLLYEQGSISQALFLDREGVSTTLDFFSPEAARQRLSDLISWFRKGKSHPLLFTPDIGAKALEGNPETVRRELEKKANGNYVMPADPYMDIMNREGGLEALDEIKLEEMQQLALLLNITG